MKALRKSALHLAMAASLLGGVVSVDVQAQAPSPSVSRTGLGSALIFPYYTVNAGWATTFNVTNTSANTLAVKVRFHERKNSRDVLDFVIVLSPYDVWTGWVQDSDQGTQLFTNDSSCTSPLDVNGATASQIAYTGEFDDGAGVGLNRLREGYVEVLLMGVADAGDEKVDTSDNTSDAYVEGSLAVPYYAKHVNGTPRDCSIVDAAFVPTASDWAPDTYPTDYDGTLPSGNLAGSGDPPARIDFRAPSSADNVLKGNVAWLQTGTGAGAGSEAIAVSDYITYNAVTAQAFPWFLEPTFASDGGLWTVDGVTAFEGAVSATETMNEWANNAATGANIDWVVTFPTKGYHVDKFNEQIQAAVSKYRTDPATATDPSGFSYVVSSTGANTEAAAQACDADRAVCKDVQATTDVGVVEVAPFAQLFGVQAASEGLTLEADSRIPLKYALFDREEQGQALSGTSISPAPPPTSGVMRFEANVIQWGEGSALGAAQPNIIDASTILSGAPNGWANINFNGQALPVAAFAIKARNQGSTLTNFGQAMNNAYTLPDNDNL